MNEEILDDMNQGRGELPQMLNVLTILTFIGSGLAVLSSLYRLITKTSQIEALNSSIELIAQSDISDFLKDSAIEGVTLNIEHFG